MTNARGSLLIALVPFAPLVALVPFVIGGCVTTVEPAGPIPASGPKAPAGPWTQRFMTPTVLVADRISTRGRSARCRAWSCSSGPARSP